MTKPSNVPVAPKTLDLDDLLDDFTPRMPTKPGAAQNHPGNTSEPVSVPRLRQTETSFPSREPKGPKHVQVNCYLKSDVAARFKAFLKRDEYTTWSYGDAIEYLLDQHDKSGKRAKS